MRNVIILRRINKKKYKNQVQKSFKKYKNQKEKRSPVAEQVLTE